MVGKYTMITYFLYILSMCEIRYEGSKDILYLCIYSKMEIVEYHKEKI